VIFTLNDVPAVWAPRAESSVAVTSKWSSAPYGTTAFDAEEAEPVPFAFVAVTVKVYEVPAVSPVTVHDVEVDVGAAD